MRYLFSFLAFFYLNTNLFGQNDEKTTTTLDYNTNFMGNPQKNGMWLPGKVEDNTISGSQYLFTNWNGMFSIINNSGNKFNLLNLNYNIFTQKLESKISNDSVFQYDLSMIQYILHEKSKYRIFNNELFQQLLDNKKFEFLKSYKIIIQEAVFNPLTQTDLTPRRYIVKNEYKMLSEGVLLDFKLNKKSVFNFFPENKELILKFVDENKLSYTKEDDVIKILHYLSNN